MIDEGIVRIMNIIKRLDRFNQRNYEQNEKCDVDVIIDNCLTMHCSLLKTRIEINKQYTKVPHSIRGNESELHHVFLNALTNAIQAIIGKGTISISTEVKKEKLTVQISDTGCGISSENIKKVTDPFFTTKDPDKGTGLGMSIAYSIVEKHNGNIKYKSEVGKGTTVVITLPIDESL